MKNNNQTIIRGICAFFIMLTHISNFTSNNCILRVFTPFGYLWVGIFFYFSGYNLIKSYLTKTNFFHHFWTKKIVKIYIPLVLSNIILFVIYKYLNGYKFEDNEIMKYIFGIKCINDVNWYIYAIIVFYFSSWSILLLNDRLLKKTNNNKLLLNILAMLIMIIYSYLYHNVGLKLYLSTSIRNVFPLTLYFGMIYFINKDKIDFLLRKQIIRELLIIILFILSTSLHYANMNKIEFLNFNNEIIDYLVPITFTLLVIIGTSKINLKSKFFEFMNYISLETYIYHFVILNLFSNSTIKFTNDYLFLIIYFVFTILISYLTAILTRTTLNFTERKFKNEKK